MTVELVTWLRAQLDEVEQIARAAYDLKHRGEWVWRKDSRTTVRAGDGLPIEPAAPGVERGPHIARWHPARVLAEVDTKRRIIDYVSGWRHRVIGDCWYSCPKSDEGCCDENAGDECTCWVEPVRDRMLRLMALPYADRPGYQEEWRPSS